jgi:AraC-like DNA-binding protein
MPRKAVYLLVLPNGPTADEQLALVRKAFKLTKQDQIYIDDLAQKYRRKDTPLVERGVALRQLRAGDALVIPTPGGLGVGRDDIRSVLQQLGQMGRDLLVASTGKTVRWTEETADAVEFLDLATLERRRKAAANAREVQMALGRTYIPEEKAMLLDEETVRLMWFDRVRYPSRQEIAEKAGVSDRTLHTRFGPRTGRKNRKRK